MTDKKPASLQKSHKTFLIIAGVVLAVIMVALFIVTPAKKTDTGEQIAPAETASTTPPAPATQEPTPPATASTETPTTTPTTTDSTAPATAATTETPATATTEAKVADATPAKVADKAPTPPAAVVPPSPLTPPTPPGPKKPNIDSNAALSDRILGDTSAPVKISEHASLTCPHCGEFDVNVFEKIKKNYIDTKKAYWVFSDFPLNEPAFQAAMIARCLPQNKYFDFIHMLFAKQSEWANSSSYLSYLKDKAAKEGLDSASVDACLDNKDIKEGMTNRMKAVTAQWHINSTPSFVFNNKTVISGAYPYDDLAKAIDGELQKIPGAQAPSTAKPTEAPAVEAPAATEDKPATKATTEPAAKGDSSAAQ